MTTTRDLIDGRLYELTTRGRWNAEEKGFIRDDGSLAALGASLERGYLDAALVEEPLPTTPGTILVVGIYAFRRIGGTGRVWTRTGTTTVFDDDEVRSAIQALGLTHTYNPTSTTTTREN